MSLETCFFPLTRSDFKKRKRDTVKKQTHYLECISSETESRILPFCLLREIMALPEGDLILSLKPCLFLRLRFDGWYVLFMRLNAS